MDWKSTMVIEAIASTHKRTRKRATPPDPQALLGLLDAGDLRFLQWLLRYPFQRAEDLALATASSRATVYRHLGVLQTMGLIEQVMPPALGARTCRLYHLSNVGVQVIVLQEQYDPRELARAWSMDERGLLRLLPRLASLITLQDCINGLVTHAPEALAHRGHRSEVRWHWVRDYANHFLYREKQMRCTADAALLLRVHLMNKDHTSVQEQWYSLFLLLDGEIAGDTWLKQRMQRLLCYRESAERWPVYQHFPQVVVLVSTPRRIEHWQWSVREAANALHVAPLSGAIACLPGELQMASFNPWRVPWKTLGTNGSCALQHLLHPLPMEAIPPGLWDHLATDHVILETAHIGDGGAPTMTSPTRKRARMIVGNYMERANAVPKNQRDDAHDEQEIIALLGLSLGKRHLDLLKMLYTYPLLHLREVAELLERESSSIERYMHVLHRCGCIVPVRTEVGQRWRLCVRGLRLIAAAQHLKIHSIVTLEENNEEVNLVQQRVDVLLRHVEHTAGIYGFFASLSQVARQERLQGRKHRLLWWETGPSCERRYHNHDRWHNLRPDAYADYQAGERRVRFWLEWDRATMGTRDLVAKFRTYAYYVTSREWFREQHEMPYLLIVVPGKEQEMRIIRIAEAVLVDTPGLVIQTTTVTRLADQEPLAAIWYKVTTKERSAEMVPRSRFYNASPGS
jgi:predicted transcriptional regulator